MLTALMIALRYMYQLALGPALIIVLVTTLAFALRFPSHKKAAAVFLFIFGIVTLGVTLRLGFSWGFFIGLTILGIGLALGIIRMPKRLSSSRIRRSIYVIFICVVIVCSMLIAIRLTGVVREEWLETYSVSSFGDSPNVILKGTVTSYAYNFEVNTGYSYHIFPAHIELEVTEIVWSNSSHRNWTINYENLNQHFSEGLIIYYEKMDVPNLAVGQRIEVKGVFCGWYEDSMYSFKLVVSPLINGSYLKPL